MDATTSSARAALVATITPGEKLGVGDEGAALATPAACARTLKARVVALDQVLFYNRFGAHQPGGMIYALERDVEPLSGPALTPGNVRLRSDKRPRPLTLRMNVGDCLDVTFTNLLAPTRVDEEQPATRSASMRVDGVSLVGNDESFAGRVGENDDGLALPRQTRVYRWAAPREGTFRIFSQAALVGGDGNAGQQTMGLFGVLTVEPRGSVWYRSQLTASELDLVTTSKDPAGHRAINYKARYPAGHRFQGRPVVAILDGDEIFHSDLHAIIADIPPGTYPPVATAAPNDGNARSRDEPFREFTVAYHDEAGLVQAFDDLQEDPATFSSVFDNMAINYGSGAAGAAVMSTGPAGTKFRLGVGPAAQCNDCKFEEASLSSWALGDPAMVIERAPAQPGEPMVAGPAIAALYPDDPANVVHSYLGDHVRMRVVHGGSREHHVHHLHAHQWLHESDVDGSSYNDSQAFGPGSSYTFEISFNGSGNRNKTVGDAIFHCHFYPHFAQGMWSLWRVHDVFEDGTRTLPDAELTDGTPIPAVLPLPGLAMAPPPSPEMPGYPFYIPGVPGHRAPHPPLDTIDDGGLPRHVVLGGTTVDGVQGPFDRVSDRMTAMQLPEDGTELEKAAMRFHAEKAHATVTPDGVPATFITNGLPAVRGAPFADPCTGDGAPIGPEQLRTLKGAAIQIDAVFNKVGWHFPQTRMLAHWADIADFRSGARAPEPFFMRAHSGDCIEYHLTNLLPGVYKKDDFQVFTPTDIIGQHIHLVKFDVTSSDGGANGFNYEDGSFAPDEVIERIEAINADGGLLRPDGTTTHLEPRAHPYFGVMGAQTTVQRWWADPILDLQGSDRRLRTVFTHDHLGPSTHQQTGLYAGLLIEPAGSTWRHPETGATFGERFDGGPTSFRADILTADPQQSYREFNLQVADFALAYTRDNKPVNPPNRKELGLPHLFAAPDVPRPEAVSAADPGTHLVNYRNEPLAWRLYDPVARKQATGQAGDPAWAFSSRTPRRAPELNVQPSTVPPLTADVGPLDPYTPLLRAYEGDDVTIQVLAGAHEETHGFALHGQRWLHDADSASSGYKATQLVGLSEHFEFRVPVVPAVLGARQTDFLYDFASVEARWSGVWGLMRTYGRLRGDLLPLPNNPDGSIGAAGAERLSAADVTCPTAAPRRLYDVTAVRAADALPGGTLVYNAGHGLHDPTALLYVLTSDLDKSGRLRAGAPREPLVLRAAAGECVVTTLRNALRAAPLDAPGFNAFPMLIEQFNANQLAPSQRVGLHAQLVQFDVRRENGVNVGMNDDSTVAPGQARTYTWYAGKSQVLEDGTLRATPIEFGATNLFPADPLKHTSKGLVAALVVEPEGSSWTFPDAGTRTTADVTSGSGTFREFVAVLQDDLVLREPIVVGDKAFPLGKPIPPPGGGTVASPRIEDAEDSGNKALNARTEPLWTRVGYAPGLDFGATNDLEFSNSFQTSTTGPIETPIFVAAAGTRVRFRVLDPGGHNRGHVFSLQGHSWRHEPNNPHSSTVGTQDGVIPQGHWDMLLLDSAGGAMGLPGDYLLRDASSISLDGGIWGVLRVLPAPPVTP